MKERAEKEREKKVRERASAAERGETRVGTKREVQKACRSVPHSGISGDDKSKRNKQQRERADKPRERD